ncbi:hypothetical protein MJO28_016528 [Puccinia striiformis f. sp. tritici]|uniref:Uncharacterized protein n=1 Tax=Puccinia striiformis f. sp. tritici TaxID=168172 RepID=A0ACC0DNK1_9BASI|nr:hypothetical protein MJO28_016528 [Puccinia striiformis f. sp. tritici]
MQVHPTAKGYRQNGELAVKDSAGWRYSSVTSEVLCALVDGRQLAIDCFRWTIERNTPAMLV